MSQTEITPLRRTEARTDRLFQCIAAVRAIEMAIASRSDLPQILNLVLEKIDVILPAPARSTFILVFDGRTGGLEPLVHRNIEEGGLSIADWETWAPFARVAFETKMPVKLFDLQADNSTSGVDLFKKQGWVSYLGLPLLAQEQALGVLSIYSKSDALFGDEELELLSLLSSQAVATIRQYQLGEQSRNRLVQLENENRAKTQFLGLLSTELRTPLNSVMGYATLLQEKILGEITPEQETALGGVLHGCEGLLKLINRILEVLKVETLKDQVLKGTRSLTEAVDDFERETIMKALQNSGFNQTKAASLLGITRRVLRYKMGKLKLAPPSGEAKKETDPNKGSSDAEE